MKKIVYSLPLLALFLFSSFSFAQQQPDSIYYQTDDVVVTGTRTEKKIIDIPFSVVRIGKEQFKYSRSLTVDDVLRTVPGLFLQNRYGTHDVRISIRGFGSRSNTGIRGVRILQDGIPESEPDGQTRIETIDFSALGSIEVVKGNSSSLYTNAPGGVINFISDMNFPRSFAVTHNQFGEFNLRQNGVKVGILANDWRLMMNYSYRNYKGYREHSTEHQNLVNMVAETYLSNNTSFAILLNSAIGTIRLPGSISEEQFNEDPFQPNPQDVSRDTRRDSRKGRLGIKFNTFFGKNNNNQLEVIGYGVIKEFIRTAATYRLFARYGVGAQFRFINNSKLSRSVNNEFSVGGDGLFQTGPIAEYENINGQQGDVQVGLTDETISNAGAYFQDQISFMNGKFSILLTGRYDKIVFDQKDLNFAAADASRVYDRFTPKAGLLYKITPHIALYTSYGLGFDTPAGNELANYPISSNPGILINPDLEAQKSNNFEVGIKADIVRRKSGGFLPRMFTEITFFNSMIEDEVVPFSVSGDVYYRNAGKTNRTGLEFGFNADIVKGLNLNTAYSFSDFKYDEYTARSIDEQGLISDEDFSGNYVPSIPKHLVSVDLIYQRPLTKNLTGYIKGNYNYVDKMFSDDANDATAGSYILLNGTVGLDLTVKNFNINLSGGMNNITDKVYAAFININADPNRTVERRRYYEAGAPRNFFASLNLGYTLN